MALFLGCLCLSTAWAGKVPPKNASDYGSNPDSECSPATFTFPNNPVTATCFIPSSGSSSFLANFTVDSAHQNSSFSVTGFEINLPSGFDSFGLLMDCSSSGAGGTPLPCITSDEIASEPLLANGLPFDLSSTTAGVYDFTGFTGNYSGQVTVFFDCPFGTTCSMPSITGIETSSGTTPTPEPRSYSYLATAVVLGVGLLRRRAWAKAS